MNAIRDDDIGMTCLMCERFTKFWVMYQDEKIPFCHEHEAIVNTAVIMKLIKDGGMRVAK